MASTTPFGEPAHLPGNHQSSLIIDHDDLVNKILLLPTQNNHETWPQQRSPFFITSTSAAKVEVKSSGKLPMTLWHLSLPLSGSSLFLRELRIDFEDKRYTYDESWQAIGKEFQEKGLSLTRKLPVLEMDDHILSQVCINASRLASEIDLTSFPAHPHTPISVAIRWKLRWRLQS